MSDDIVKRLRKGECSQALCCLKAADEIDRLHAELAAEEQRVKVMVRDTIELRRMLTELRAELAAERERVEAATHYATQITVWTVKTFFEPDKTGWKPLTGLLGVLFQLDNALVGVKEKNAKLREALEPFAAHAEAILSSIPDDRVICGYEQYLYAGDLRRALAVLEETEES